MNGLSVCIPIYNFNAIALIKGLNSQLCAIKMPFEIIVFDDASNSELTELASLSAPNYTYKKLETNVGRAKIRNILANHAKYNHILFLDGDSGIPENFISNYLNAIKQFPNSVIIGGRKHLPPSEPNKKLRYNYGIHYEDKTSKERMKNPYYSIMTNNFIVPKKLLIQIPFNEKITKYGHEDSFFGFELEKNNIKIVHINNPVIHLDLDNAETFISKTKTGLENLILLKNTNSEFASYNKLLLFVSKNRFLNIGIIKFTAKILAKTFEQLTLKTNSSYCFQWFKFYYIISKNN